MYRYFKKVGNTDHISSWKSIGLPDEIIKLPDTSDNSIAPSWSYSGTKTKVKFDGNCLKQINLYLHIKIL